MTLSNFGGLGIKAHGLGQWGLGGLQPSQSYAVPTMAKKTSAYVAHLFDVNMVFKRTLGGASILKRPSLKQTQNGGFQPIVLDLAAPVSAVALGNVIRLTERDDNSGRILFSGNVETTPDEVVSPSGATHHQISLSPWNFELADADFNHTYSTPTDVAQFVRDAVAQTAHCSVSPISCPDTGITAMYDFQSSNALDAIHVAKQIAGAFYWYFTDALGVVWFQPVYLSNPATLTLERPDMSRRKSSGTTAGMRNRIRIFGGGNPGDPGRITSLYDNPASQALYGLKAMNPTPSYPSVTDQATLDRIAASLGAQFDRVINTVEIDCPALGLRLSPARPGGFTVRYRESSVEALPESGAGSGQYSPTLMLQDVEALGAPQKLVIADIPFADIDTAYEATRIAQRIAVGAATAVATPALTPAVAPPTTKIYGYITATPGIKPMGGGIITIATMTFVSPVTGTCQIVGALDARMEAWDNYIAAPRRAVRAVLSGGIFTGTWQELPFGLARATYDLSSASGIALPGGTYTVSIQIDTQEYNQMHIYSGYVQVAVTA